MSREGFVTPHTFIYHEACILGTTQVTTGHLSRFYHRSIDISFPIPLTCMYHDERIGALPISMFSTLNGHSLNTINVD